MSYFLRWLDEMGGARKANPAKPVYIRFGIFDRRCRSYNHNTGAEEKGLSVYRAKWVDGAVALVDDDSLRLTPRDCAHVLRNRVAIPVAGIEAGVGADGEPLVRQARPVAAALDIRSMRQAIGPRPPASAPS